MLINEGQDESYQVKLSYHAWHEVGAVDGGITMYVGDFNQGVHMQVFGRRVVCVRADLIMLTVASYMHTMSPSKLRE